jgi:hypothetical protein
VRLGNALVEQAWVQLHRDQERVYCVVLEIAVVQRDVALARDEQRRSKRLLAPRRRFHGPSFGLGLGFTGAERLRPCPRPHIGALGWCPWRMTPSSLSFPVTRSRMFS